MIVTFIIHGAILLSSLTTSTAACGCKTPLYNRQPCEYGSWLGLEQCTSLGCCFDGRTSYFALAGKPRCYVKISGCKQSKCDIRLQDREVCGFRYMGKEMCERSGCCFDDKRMYPMCFRARHVPTVQTSMRVTAQYIPRVTYFTQRTEHVTTSQPMTMTERITTQPKTTTSAIPITTKTTTSATPVTTKPITSARPITKKPTTSATPVTTTEKIRIFYGPLGVYNFAGFKIFAQCPKPGEKVRECVGDFKDRNTCYRHFCCWLDGAGCYLPKVNILEWPKDNSTTEMKFLWSPWTTWSACPTSCKPTNQMRFRECLSEKAGQIPCQGLKEETRPCKLSCDSMWTNWGSWTSCSYTCGPGTKTRTRLCRQKGNLTLPRNCSGGKFMQQEVCNAELCSEWSQWKELGCPVTCGGGIGRIERKCLNKNKLIIQDGVCRRRAKVCGSTPCPIPPQAEQKKNWGSWSKCSNPCGVGMRKRIRDCDGTHAGQDDGSGSGDETLKRCDATEEELCNQDLCTSWSPWLPTAGCTASCGTGLQTEVRSCTNTSSSIVPSKCTLRVNYCNMHNCT